MPVTKVNGALFRRMVINGAINLKNNYKEIDLLNVFPVPDGDTGTNMQMTMMAGVREIENADIKKMAVLSKTLSRGLLMGARGNSGVILSQFFRGMYDAFRNIKNGTVTLKQFASALTSGYKMAYKAVMEPVEGTILTVVRESADALTNKLNDITDLETMLVVYLEEAKASLERTPDLLPVLKEAGVVDSGGAGFIKIFEGMLMMLQGIKLEYSEEDQENRQQALFHTSDIKFGYCTEFIIELKEKDKFDESELKDILANMGDSLVVVLDEETVKVHVHVNRPGDVLNIAVQYGDIITTKIENMRLQHSELITTNPVIKEGPKKQVKRQKYAVIAVCFGDGIKETFKDLGVDYIIDGGQTMNPATEEFVKAVEHVNADNVMILPNNSNVILAAEHSAKLVKGSNVSVIKAKSIAQGYASLMVFDPNNPIESNVNDMTSAIENMRSGEVTYAVRDTEINGVKISKEDFMGISKNNIIISDKSREKVVEFLIDEMLHDEAEIITLFYGVDVSKDEAEKVKNHIREINKDIEVEVINGKQGIYSYVIAVE